MIRNQVFHKQLLLIALCAFLKFLFLWLTFRLYSIYDIMCEICDKNISNEKYENLRNCLCKTKNWIKLFLKKGPSLQQKGTFVWQKCSWIGLSRKAVGSLFPQLEVVFDTFVSNQEKVFFFKKGTFWQSRTLYLCKIGPDQLSRKLWWNLQHHCNPVRYIW